MIKRVFFVIISIFFICSACSEKNVDNTEVNYKKEYVTFIITIDSTKYPINWKEDPNFISQVATKEEIQRLDIENKNYVSKVIHSKKIFLQQMGVSSEDITKNYITFESMTREDVLYLTKSEYFNDSFFSEKDLIAISDIFSKSNNLSIGSEFITSFLTYEEDENYMNGKGSNNIIDLRFKISDIYERKIVSKDTTDNVIYLSSENLELLIDLVKFPSEMIENTSKFVVKSEDSDIFREEVEKILPEYWVLKEV